MEVRAFLAVNTHVGRFVLAFVISFVGRAETVSGINMFKNKILFVNQTFCGLFTPLLAAIRASILHRFNPMMTPMRVRCLFFCDWSISILNSFNWVRLLEN